MSDRKAMAKRIAIGAFYIPLYHLVLYPIALGLGIALFLLNALFTFVTGRESEWKPSLSSAVWDWASRNIRFIWTGEGEFKWIPA